MHKCYLPLASTSDIKMEVTCYPKRLIKWLNDDLLNFKKPILT